MQSGINPSTETTVTDVEQEWSEAQNELAEGRQRSLDTALKEAELREAAAEQSGGTGVSQEQQQPDQPQEEVDDKVDTIGEVFQEVGTIIGGGLTRAAESTLTLPEKLIDIGLTGEYADEERNGGYEADFMNPFKGYEHPMARTWWGGALQEVVHIAGIIAGLKFAAGKAATSGLVRMIPGSGAAISAATGVFTSTRRIPFITKTASKIPFLKGAVRLTPTVGNLTQGAAYGAAIDIANENISEGDNLSRMIVNKVPALDPILGPLATNEEDHPLMHLFKHVLEGMGIGSIFDSIHIKKSGIKGIETALNRADGIIKQRVERAKDQLRNTEFGGFKNKDIADPWQGNPTSVGDGLRQTLKSLDDIDEGVGLDQGSVPGLLTNAEVSRMAESTGLEESILQKHLSDLLEGPQYEAERALWKAQGLSPVQVRANSLRRMQEAVFTRDWTEVDTEEFWESFFKKQAYTGPETDLHFWTPDHVVTADAINGALFKKLRDQAISAREVFKIADVLDTDGPMQGIAEKLVVGLTNTKRSRYIISNQLSQLRRPSRVDLADATSMFHQEARETVQMMMDVIGKDDNTDLLEAVLEAFSMSNNIRNFSDLDAFMRAKLNGGEFKGRVNTAQWIREMQGVMVHSILSGPKTPLRAIMGTSTASFLRPISQGLGYAMRRDGDGLRASLAATNAYIESIPESWKLFKNRLNSYWSGDLSSVKTRFSEYNKGNEQWELMRRWSEGPRATDGDKAAFRVANLARNLNDNSFLTYSTKIMAATDDSFRYLMARSRAREKAMRLMMDQHKVGNVTEITPELLKDAENHFLSKLLDKDGNINVGADEFLEAAAKEATLTTDLSGFAGGLEDLFNRTPLAKPFFLFARTGINGLALTAKNTPLLNYALKSQREIFSTKLSDNLEHLYKYGIKTADDLANAKALAMGRQAIGGSVIFLAGQHFMSGNLTGNGPADRSKRQAWIDSGWKPRSIRIGGVWVGYESMEPFNQVLAAVADVGDNMELMGPEWAEMNFARAAFIVGQGATSKTYMQGLSQLVDLMSGEAHQWQKIVGGIANNTLPLGGLRNEIGKVLNPGMRELSSHLGDAVRNRNLLFEYGPGQDLPKKYDMLNGNVINDWWFPHQLWQSIIPIPISLSQGPGRTLLFNSNYDLRLSTYTAPDGTSLADHPEVRSKFQQAIGAQNLEAELNKLAKKKSIQNSVAQMEADLKAGNRQMDPMKAYTHNLVIKQLFTRARSRAWASLRDDPQVQKLIQERRTQQATTFRRRQSTSPLSHRYKDVLNLQPK